jgi:glutamyl-tRNA(Gln) amidotransferase subunit E
LPELFEQKLERLVKQYGLNEKLAKQVLDSEYSELFEILVKETKVSATTVAAFMTETLKALRREGVHVDRVSESQIRETFSLVSSGELTREAIPEVVSWLSQHEGKTVQEAINSIGLKMLTREELQNVVDSAFERNRSLIEERGENAFGSLVGIIMKEVRGKAGAALVSELVKRKFEQTRGK